MCGNVLAGDGRAPVAINDHGAEQQAPHYSVVQPLWEERRPDPQEAVDVILAKTIAGHKRSACKHPSRSEGEHDVA